MIHPKNGVIRYSYNDISVWFIALLSLFQWSLREIFRFTPMIKIDFANTVDFPWFSQTNQTMDCCKTHGHPSIFHRYHRAGPAAAAPARRGAATELRAVRRDAQVFSAVGRFYQHHLPDIYHQIPTSFTNIIRICTRYLPSDH